jgi:hypothetical protein
MEEPAPYITETEPPAAAYRCECGRTLGHVRGGSLVTRGAIITSGQVRCPGCGRWREWEYRRRDLPPFLEDALERRARFDAWADMVKDDIENDVLK